MKAIDIEVAVATHFNPRTNIIVPNVSWGMFLHECDLLILSKSGYATEVEIKVSASDLKKDLEKKHAHANVKIKYFYFAIPAALEQYRHLVPAHAGIIIVGPGRGCSYTSSYSSGCELYDVRVVRYPEVVNTYRWSDDERFQLARLGSMRIWSLKHKLLTLEQRNLERGGN